MPSDSTLKRVSGLMSRVNATTGTPSGAPSRQRCSAAERPATTTVARSFTMNGSATSARAATRRAQGNSRLSVSTRGSRAAGSSTSTRITGIGRVYRGAERPPPTVVGSLSMTKEISIVHHADRRTDVMMPYAPGIVVRRGKLVFLSGVTAAAVYHSHPHRDEEFDLPPTMREQAVLTMENLKKTLEAAGCTFADLVSATRFLTNVAEQDELNRVWASYLGGHLPTTTTVEVSRLATHARCKIEISAIAVVDEGNG